MLLVDDNAAFREMTEMALNSLGYSVQPCSSPDVAIATASGSPHLELLITDVIMAKMNGIQLAERIRQFCPKIKVLFCSGYPESALARQGLEITAGEFLMKPISLGALTSKIEALLAQPEAA